MEVAMNRYRFTVIFFTASFLFSVLSEGLCIHKQNNQSVPKQSLVAGKAKALVVYYSRTGNTKVIAESIREVLKGDIQEIKDMKDRSGFFGFIGGMIDSKKHPLTEISPREVIIKDYDLIIIGSPGWGVKLTPAINTFITRTDFTGKKVVLFGVASARIKQGTLDEYSKVITSKGGRVIDTFIIKTLFINQDEMRAEARKISKERTGKWTQ
jgi:flavodoxin